MQKKFTTKTLVFAAAALALGVVTSVIKVFEAPMGGSITLFSMLFIVLIGYWYGPVVGIIGGVAYGVLQFLIEPFFLTPVQALCDYVLAFGALGLSGFFSKKKWGLQVGYIVGVLGRYLFSFISGVAFFAEYAEGSGMGSIAYSLAYNGLYLGIEGAATLVIIFIPPVAKALRYVKKLASAEFKI